MIPLLIAIVLSGCGVPSFNELLAGKRIVCSVKIKVPEDQRFREEIDISEVTLENCREKQ